jgi:hypothetical protein
VKYLEGDYLLARVKLVLPSGFRTVFKAQTSFAKATDGDVANVSWIWMAGSDQDADCISDVVYVQSLLCDLSSASQLLF